MTLPGWIRHGFYRLRLMPLTGQKISEYYLLRDTRSLNRALEIAPWYLKRHIIHYLGEIGGMKSYHKLYEMLQQDKKLELELFVAIMNIVLRHPEEIPDEDSLYLHSRLDLLDQLYSKDEVDFPANANDESEARNKKSRPLVFDATKGLFGNRRSTPKWIDNEGY